MGKIRRTTALIHPIIRPSMYEGPYVALYKPSEGPLTDIWCALPTGFSSRAKAVEYIEAVRGYGCLDFGMWAVIRIQRARGYAPGFPIVYGPRQKVVGRKRLLPVPDEAVFRPL